MLSSPSPSAPPSFAGGGGGEDRAEFGDFNGYGYNDADRSAAVFLPKEDKDRTNKDVNSANFSATSASASSSTYTERRLTTTYDTLSAGTTGNT